MCFEDGKKQLHKINILVQIENNKIIRQTIAQGITPSIFNA